MTAIFRLKDEVFGDDVTYVNLLGILNSSPVYQASDVFCHFSFEINSMLLYVH